MAASVKTPVTTPFLVNDFPKEGLGSRESLDGFFRKLNSQVASVASPLNGALTISGNMNAQVKNVTIHVPSTDNNVVLIGSTKGPAFQHSWAASGAGQAPAYHVLSTGEVELIGVLTGGTLNTVAFQLPAALAPSAVRQWATFDWSGAAGSVAWVKIDTSGNVTVNGASNNQIWLDGVRFTPAAPAPGILSCFPFSLQTTVNQPVGVHIVALQDLTVRTAVAAPGGVVWKSQGVVGGQPTVQIQNLPGLILGHTYQATFIIWGG